MTVRINPGIDHIIENAQTPTNDTDVSNKAYVDENAAPTIPVPEHNGVWTNTARSDVMVPTSGVFRIENANQADIGSATNIRLIEIHELDSTGANRRTDFGTIVIGQRLVMRRESDETVINDSVIRGITLDASSGGETGTLLFLRVESVNPINFPHGENAIFEFGPEVQSLDVRESLTIINDRVTAINDIPLADGNDDVSVANLEARLPQISDDIIPYSKLTGEPTIPNAPATWAERGNDDPIPADKLPREENHNIDEELDTLPVEQLFTYTAQTTTIQRVTGEDYYNSLGLTLLFTGPFPVTGQAANGFDPEVGDHYYGWIPANLPTDFTDVGTEANFALRVNATQAINTTERLVTFDVLRGHEFIPRPANMYDPDITISDARFDTLYTRANSGTHTDEVLTRRIDSNTNEHTFEFRRPTAVTPGQTVTYSPDGGDGAALTRIDKVNNNNTRDLEFNFGGNVDSLFTDTVNNITYSSSATLGNNEARYNAANRTLTAMGVTVGDKGDTIQITLTAASDGTQTVHTASIVSDTAINNTENPPTQIGSTFVLSPFDIEPTFAVNDRLDFLFIKPSAHRFIDGDNVLAPEQTNVQFAGFNIRNDAATDRLVLSDPRTAIALALAEDNPLHGFHADNTAITGDVPASSLVISPPTGDLSSFTTDTNSGIVEIGGTTYTGFINTHTLEFSLFVANTAEITDGTVDVGTVFNLGTFAEESSTGVTRTNALAQVQVTSFGPILTSNGNVRRLVGRPYNGIGTARLQANEEQPTGVYEASEGRVYFPTQSQVLNANSNTLRVRAHPAEGFVISQNDSSGNPGITIGDGTDLIQPVVREVNDRDHVAHLIVTTSSVDTTFEVAQNIFTRPGEITPDRVMRWNSNTNTLELHLTPAATLQLAQLTGDRPINFSLTGAIADEASFLVDREDTDGPRTTFTATPNAGGRAWLLDSDNHDGTPINGVYYYRGTSIQDVQAPPTELVRWWTWDEGNTGRPSQLSDFTLDGADIRLNVFPFDTATGIDRPGATTLLDDIVMGDNFFIFEGGSNVPLIQTTVMGIGPGAGTAGDSFKLLTLDTTIDPTIFTNNIRYEFRIGSLVAGAPVVHSIITSDNTGVRYDPVRSRNLGFPTVSTFSEPSFTVLNNDASNFPANPTIGSRVYSTTATNRIVIQQEDAEFERLVTVPIPGDTATFTESDVFAESDGINRMIWHDNGALDGSRTRIQATELAAALNNIIPGREIRTQTDVINALNGRNVRLVDETTNPETTHDFTLASPFFEPTTGTPENADRYGGIGSGSSLGSGGSHRIYVDPAGSIDLNDIPAGQAFPVEIETAPEVMEERQPLAANTFYTYIGTPDENDADVLGWIREGAIIPAP